MLVWTADNLRIKPLGKLRTSPITNKTTIARQITGATRVKVAITTAETSSNKATKKFDIPTDSDRSKATAAGCQNSYPLACF